MTNLRPYRILFTLAAIYNLAFGLWTGIFPQHFFHLFGLPPINYPAIWSCLGMVVGLYGILYAWVARHPEQGDMIIGVGLLGKLLGPLGWLWNVWQGDFSAKTFPLILLNDLIWWFPFLFYLFRNKRDRARRIVAAMVGVHLLACFGFLWIQGGSEFVADLNARMVWVRGHEARWITVWWLWAVSSLSYPTFVICWVGALRKKFFVAKGLWACVLLAALGVGMDLIGEGTYITWLPTQGQGLPGFQRGVEIYTLFSAALANAAYCIAGFILCWVSWKRGLLRGAVVGSGFFMWVVGFSLTAFALIGNRVGILASAAATMILFIPWAAWVGWKYFD